MRTTVPRPNIGENALCPPPATQPPEAPIEAAAPPTTNRPFFWAKSYASCHWTPAPNVTAEIYRNYRMISLNAKKKIKTKKSPLNVFSGVAGAPLGTKVELYTVCFIWCVHIKKPPRAVLRPRKSCPVFFTTSLRLCFFAKLTAAWTSLSDRASTPTGGTLPCPHGIPKVVFK